jgi:hypothetical protein
MIFMCVRNPFKEAAKQHRSYWFGAWRSVLLGGTELDFWYREQLS